MNIKRIREANYTIMQQANFIRSKYEDISDNYLANPTIQKLLLSNLNAPSQTLLIQNTKTIEQTLSDSKDKIYTMIVGDNSIIYQPYSENYKRITYEEVRNSEIYKQSLLSDGGNLWLTSDQNLITRDSKLYLYLLRTYMSVNVLYKPLGQLIIRIPINELQQVFKESNNNSSEYYAIIDSTGKYIYHTQNAKLIGEQADNEILAEFSSKEDGYKFVRSGEDDFLLTYSIYRRNGWNVIHMLPMELIRASARQASNNVILIMLVSMIISLPVLMLILRSFTHPIRTLKTAVERFGNGDSEIRAKTDRLDEIGLLQNSFNKMAEKINDQMGKIEEDNKQKRLMEINMLEYQINPHFLYNSLDFINWMAQKSGNEDISEMVVALARFFRVGLSKGKEYYTVKDELDHVRQYLLINKLRFKDCFRFEIEADPDILMYSTIKIILQPAVENAIKHGINKYKTDGLIRVSAKKVEEAIVFEVSDNGDGIGNEKLEFIQKMMVDHTQLDGDSGNGFGLYNVNMRIWMQFGDGYGVTIENADQAGTTVRIKIPAVSFNKTLSH